MKVKREEEVSRISFQFAFVFAFGFGFGEWREKWRKRGKNEFVERVWYC
jgi:hypothetical protein